MSAEDARSDQPDSELTPSQQARVMALKIVVIVLGAIMAVMALVVFSTLIWRAVKSGGSSAPEKAASARPATPMAAIGNGAVPALLPKGARIVSTAMGDGKLAVTVEEGEAVTTILFDAATLTETGRIAWKRGP